MTLKDILKEHPEWKDLEFGVVNSNGDFHPIGTGNTFLFINNEYLDEETNETKTVLCLTDN